jgi:hypothetical protein
MPPVLDKLVNTVQDPKRKTLYFLHAVQAHPGANCVARPVFLLTAVGST